MVSEPLYDFYVEMEMETETEVFWIHYISSISIVLF